MLLSLVVKFVEVKEKEKGKNQGSAGLKHNLLDEIMFERGQQKVVGVKEEEKGDQGSGGSKTQPSGRDNGRRNKGHGVQERS